MAERLVDVLGGNGVVIHTYPITLDEVDGDVSDDAYQAKALDAAAHGQLVSNSELADLSARMHISRGGRMQPLDDDISTTSETKLGLEQSVRERAYALWEREGCIDGRSEEYWHRALDQHLRERSYLLWEQQGSLEGAPDGDWEKLQEFEAR